MKPNRLTNPESDFQDQLANLFQSAGSGKANFQDFIKKFQLPTPDNFDLSKFVGDIGTQYNNSSSDFIGKITGAANSLSDIAQGKFTGDLGSLVTGALKNTDLSQIYKTLDTSRQFDLNKELNNVREKFSAMGLGGSTALANALGTTSNESQANLNASITSLIPSLAGAQTGLLQAIGGLQQGAAGQLGNLSQIVQSLITGKAGLGESLLQSLLGQGSYQNSLLSQIFGFGSGDTSTYGPSTFSQGLNGIIGLIGASKLLGQNTTVNGNATGAGSGGK